MGTNSSTGKKIHEVILRKDVAGSVRVDFEIDSLFPSRDFVTDGTCTSEIFADIMKQFAISLPNQSGEFQVKLAKRDEKSAGHTFLCLTRQ